ncbi:integrase [Allomesorhizobium alhagi]|uniref:Integrase family protein n=1 Tax=Mesorhizobium alhagi CCNWXJ12-2 TaxID=1107882 RepID=H0HNL7_9HYPH|nr:integrase [Mesorhizobium alhagi]EHK57670.1 integrase family protein [Mesorhizobium alhagi CCNWXJ12-2]
MPRPAKGARLELRTERIKDRSGKLVRIEKTWIIRDRGAFFRRTGCGELDSGGAEKALNDYLSEKFQPASRESDLNRLPVAEVLTAYGREYAPHKKSAERSGYAIAALVPWWGTKTLADVRGKTCRDYAAHRRRGGVGDGTIRRELAELSKAINHWHAEHGPLASVPIVTMPDAAPPKERWLTRSEAAMLLAGALGWYREFWSDVATRKVHCRWRRNPFQINRHLARFILLGLATGSRRGSMFHVKWMANTSGGWIDLDRGVMHRRGEGVGETNKRQPPVRLGRRIMAHATRWKRLDDAARADAAEQAGEPVALFLNVVHWMGRGVSSVRTSWANAVDYAWLEPRSTRKAKVTPHVMRHTRATWLMSSGIEIWEAAGSVGMSAKTLEKVYGHHHPDFQKKAAEV